MTVSILRKRSMKSSELCSIKKIFSWYGINTRICSMAQHFSLSISSGLGKGPSRGAIERDTDHTGFHLCSNQANQTNAGQAEIHYFI